MDTDTPIWQIYGLPQPGSSIPPVDIGMSQASAPYQPPPSTGGKPSGANKSLDSLKNVADNRGWTGMSNAIGKVQNFQKDPFGSIFGGSSSAPGGAAATGDVVNPIGGAKVPIGMTDLGSTGASSGIAGIGNSTGALSGMGGASGLGGTIGDLAGGAGAAGGTSDILGSMISSIASIFA